jgi:hypothetical protein
MEQEIITYDDLALLDQLQREQSILEVLQHLLWSRKENGRKFTVAEACAASGIGESTWYDWVKEGYVHSPLEKISIQVNQVAYDHILPVIKEMITVQASLAVGRIPEDSHITSVKAKDATTAFRELIKIVPIQPADGSQAHQKSEHEHVETYQPKQILIQGDLNFIYRGEHVNAPSRNLELDDGADEED